MRRRFLAPPSRFSVALKGFLALGCFDRAA